MEITTTGQRRDRDGIVLASVAVALIGGSVAASSLVADYPLLGGQALRNFAAALLLWGWARWRGHRLPRPSGSQWGWLVALALIGVAGSGVLITLATAVADPAGVGVVIGAAPIGIVAINAGRARRAPQRRMLWAALLVTAGAAVAQAGSGAGQGWTPAGLLLCLSALGAVVGSTLLAEPVVEKLGALAVTIHSCALAGVLLVPLAALVAGLGGQPLLRLPTATELLAFGYLAVMVTAIVFLAWYAALARLGAQRVGLFNGLIPMLSLLGVAIVGTSAPSLTCLVGSVCVLVGVLIGLKPPTTRPGSPNLHQECATLPACSTAATRSQPVPVQPVVSPAAA